MNARYYEPETGRFISQDSYRGSGEEFWHLYAYCNGDPVNYTDPTGKIPTLEQIRKEALKYYKQKTGIIISNLLKENGNYAKNKIGMDIFMFNNYVQGGGNWDYKLRKVRNKDSRLVKIKDSPCVVANGIVMNWEQFGNFHYGYVGKMAGYSSQILILGSIYAAGFNIDKNETKDQAYILMGYYYENK